MDNLLLFLINSVAFGVGLAMDAFSVSLANGMNEPEMGRGRASGIAGVFAAFQTLMPLIGWFCVSRVAERFSAFQKFIPWIALVLLLYIGGKMLLGGLRSRGGEEETAAAAGFGALLVQGIATSIDALSVGFTIADLNAAEALAEALIIGTVTFFICLGGLALGRKAGTKLAGKSAVFGGAILIVIGIEIFISGILS